MDKVVKEVCEALGVNLGASRPRSELYKLLVYETGSQWVHRSLEVSSRQTHDLYSVSYRTLSE